MDAGVDALPNDVKALQAALIAARAQDAHSKELLVAAEAKAAIAEAAAVAAQCATGPVSRC